MKVEDIEDTRYPSSSSCCDWSREGCRRDSMKEGVEGSLEDNYLGQILELWRLSLEAVRSLGKLEVRGQCRFCWLVVAEDAVADSRRGSGRGLA